MKRAALPLVLYLIAAPVVGQATERQPWDGSVVGLQAATALGHAAGHAAGMLAGGAIAFSICPIFGPKECSPSKELAGYVALGASTTVFGALVGSLSTWGAGRLMDAPGRYLPTLGLAAAGHAVAGITTIVWAHATEGEGNAVWIVPIFIGSLLGTAGATVGFQTSF